MAGTGESSSANLPENMQLPKAMATVNAKLMAAATSIITCKRLPAAPWLMDERLQVAGLFRLIHLYPKVAFVSASLASILFLHVAVRIDYEPEQNLSYGWLVTAFKAC